MVKLLVSLLMAQKKSALLWRETNPSETPRLAINDNENRNNKSITNKNVNVSKKDTLIFENSQKSKITCNESNSNQSNLGDGRTRFPLISTTNHTTNKVGCTSDNHFSCAKSRLIRRPVNVINQNMQCVAPQPVGIFPQSHYQYQPYVPNYASMIPRMQNLSINPEAQHFYPHPNPPQVNNSLWYNFENSKNFENFNNYHGS